MTSRKRLIDWVRLPWTQAIPAGLVTAAMLGTAATTSAQTGLKLRTSSGTANPAVTSGSGFAASVQRMMSDARRQAEAGNLDDALKTARRARKIAEASQLSDPRCSVEAVDLLIAELGGPSGAPQGAAVARTTSVRPAAPPVAPPIVSKPPTVKAPPVAASMPLAGRQQSAPVAPPAIASAKPAVPPIASSRDTRLGLGESRAQRPAPSTIAGSPASLPPIQPPVLPKSATQTPEFAWSSPAKSADSEPVARKVPFAPLPAAVVAEPPRSVAVASSSNDATVMTWEGTTEFEIAGGEAGEFDSVTPAAETAVVERESTTWTRTTRDDASRSPEATAPAASKEDWTVGSFAIAGEETSADDEPVAPKDSPTTLAAAPKVPAIPEVDGSLLYESSFAVVELGSRSDAITALDDDAYQEPNGSELLAKSPPASPSDTWAPPSDTAASPEVVIPEPEIAKSPAPETKAPETKDVEFIAIVEPAPSATPSAAPAVVAEPARNEVAVFEPAPKVVAPTSTPKVPLRKRYTAELASAADAPITAPETAPTEFDANPQAMLVSAKVDQTPEAAGELVAKRFPGQVVTAGSSSTATKAAKSLPRDTRSKPETAASKSALSWDSLAEQTEWSSSTPGAAAGPRPMTAAQLDTAWEPAGAKSAGDQGRTKPDRARDSDQSSASRVVDSGLKAVATVELLPMIETTSFVANPSEPRGLVDEEAKPGRVQAPNRLEDSLAPASPDECPEVVLGPVAWMRSDTHAATLVMGQPDVTNASELVARWSAATGLPAATLLSGCVAIGCCVMGMGAWGLSKFRRMAKR